MVPGVSDQGRSLYLPGSSLKKEDSQPRGLRAEGQQPLSVLQRFSNTSRRRPRVVGIIMHSRCACAPDFEFEQSLIRADSGTVFQADRAPRSHRMALLASICGATVLYRRCGAVFRRPSSRHVGGLFSGRLWLLPGSFTISRWAASRDPAIGRSVTGTMQGIAVIAIGGNSPSQCDACDRAGSPGPCASPESIHVSLVELDIRWLSPAEAPAFRRWASMAERAHATPGCRA